MACRANDRHRSAGQSARLAHAEAAFAQRCDLRHIDRVDTSARRTFATPRDHAIDGSTRPLELGLDRAVVTVAHPARDGFRARSFATRITKEDTLNSSRYDDAHTRDIGGYTWHASQ